MTAPRRWRLLTLLALVALVAGALVGRSIHGEGGGERASAACAKSADADRKPAGDADAKPAADPDAKAGEEKDGDDPDREAAEERAREAGSKAGPASLYGGGPKPIEPPCGDKPGLPESYADLAAANSSRASRDVAPGTQIKPGALRSALNEKRALPTSGGNWSEFGKTPLETGRTEYDTSNGSTSEGLGNVSGRINVITNDPASGRLFAGPTEGGVWTSADSGATWTSIGDALATQAVSGVAWTSGGGGTLLALTGDNSFGGGTSSGLGAYWTTDLGRTWNHASGIPDGLLAFRLAVDPNDPSIVYAATGGGLFRSTDAGRSYTNVDLPTGSGHTPDCSGQPVTAKDCFLANIVTDVVVQGPANAATPGGTPGAVLAAVGWRAGTKPNADGTIQSPANGLYRSGTGAPGSFTNLDFAGHSTPKTDPLTQARIGRIALGAAAGADQDHRIVYAVVQDAVKFNGGVVGLDANENGSTSVAQSDYLNGIWASTDFGATWNQLEGSTTIDNDTLSGSALSPPVCKAPAVVGYCPGIQAWYNLQIQPDPTRQTGAGVPTRLAFGLEEVWQMTDTTTGLTGVAPSRATVVGRYFAGASCTLLNATNGLPVCPAAQGGVVPDTTTHPDQHAMLWVPGSGGAVTLYEGNDGGVYKQTTSATGDLSNDDWGTGTNAGLHTLQPYDVALAKDGTAYMGLQDNGEGKVDPDGRSYTVFGGDGFFTAVDPDHADIAYEEYTAGGVSATQDGGKTWTSIDPSLSNPQFATPFEMDPNDAKHLVIGGCDVRETTAGPSTVAGSGTGADNWRTVFELGTRSEPGSACPTSPVPSDDPVNQVSAVDVRSAPAPVNAPTGPKTADVSYSAGGTTVPGLGDTTGTGTFAPGSYDDHPFTIHAGDGDATATIDVTWADSSNDWDLYVYKKDGSSMTQVGSSATGGTTEERVTLSNPAAGDYVVRVANYAATGSFDAKVTFAQRTTGAQTSSDGAPSAAYVGYCGYCDTITQGTPFGSGIATNVVGGTPGKAGSAAGWHIAAAKGLPKRLITSVRMDPVDPTTVYVTLAGYARKWAEPGAVGDDTSQVGTGHVFKSTDAGQTFTNISGDLPDTAANWTVLHNGHLVTGTDLGVFESCDDAGGSYSVLGHGMPNVSVSTLQYEPADPDTMIAATYGRGLYKYTFGADPDCARPSAPGGATAGNGSGSTATKTPAKAPVKPSVCASSAGFRAVKVTPSRKGLKFSIDRAVDAPFDVDVFRESAGRTVITERRVAAFHKRTRSFTWTGRGKKVGDGVYFVRIKIASGKIRDARRLAFTRTHGRFATRRTFYALARCKLLARARLTRPVFGGSHHVSLRASASLIKSGSVTFVVKRGTRTIRRVRIAKTGTRTRSVTVSARALARGEYTVTIAAVSGSTNETVTLAGRDL